MPAVSAPAVDTIDILVAEDNDSERGTIVDTLRSSIGGFSVLGVPSGAQALNFLLGRGEWCERRDTEPPKLILLDLKLPGSDALSVLGTIRSLKIDNALTVVPVVVFTDSHNAADVAACYRFGANSYIIKPLSFATFTSVVDAVGRYWVTHNRVNC